LIYNLESIKVSKRGRKKEKVAGEKKIEIILEKY